MTELNLLPYHIKEEKNKRAKIRYYYSLCFIFIAILFLFAYLPRIYLKGLQKEESLLKAEITNNSWIIEENKKLQSEIGELKRYPEKVNLIAKQKVIVYNKMKDLEKVTPVDIKFTSLSYTKDAIVINGIVKNYSSISEFVANLQMSKNYTEARILNINYNNTSASYTFSVSIRY